MATKAYNTQSGGTNNIILPCTAQGDCRQGKSSSSSTLPVASGVSVLRCLTLLFVFYIKLMTSRVPLSDGKMSLFADD